jgi:hypothetical protein
VWNRGVGRSTRREGSLEIFAGAAGGGSRSARLARTLNDAFARAESDVGDMHFVGRISVSVIRHRKEAVGYGFRLTHPS